MTPEQVANTVNIKDKSYTEFIQNRKNRADEIEAVILETSFPPFQIQNPIEDFWSDGSRGGSNEESSDDDEGSDDEDE